MTKENKIKEKISLTSYNPIETPEEIINSDKDMKRKDAFKEAYKKVMTIIPAYFIERKRKKTGSTSSGGTSFTQNIIVTSENAKVETTKENKQQENQEERDRERED